MSLDDVPQSGLNVQHFQSSSSIMVWAAISAEGKLPLIFISPGTKVIKEYYQRQIFSKIVKPRGEALFKNHSWTFQQDSAPSHTAKVNHAWCEENLPDFISLSDWPASSSNLNHAISREWEKISIDWVRSAIDLWRPRLKACVNSGGGRFE